MDTESFHVTVLIELGLIASGVAQVNGITRVQPKRRQLASVILRVLDVEVRISV